MNKSDKLTKLLEIESLEGYSEEEALNVFLELIELSNDLGTDLGANKAIDLSQKIESSSLFPTKRSVYHYYLSVAWADIRHKNQSYSEAWKWDHTQVEQEIINLRSAVKYFDPIKIEDSSSRLCQIHTNLANSFDFCGRFVAALENWNKAIEIDSNFPMALGAKGNSMIYTGFNSLYDAGHKRIYVGLGYKYLKRAIEFPMYQNALEYYRKAVKTLESESPWVLDYSPDLNVVSETSSTEEKLYREWCLNNTLFLNPLNDLGPYPIATHDPFALPTMVVNREKAGSYHSFFNQIKQEYISARVFLFKGFKEHSQHYADKHVLKFEMLDSSVHSMRVEHLKTGFRIAYSLFDKVGYFLNYYLDLGIKEHDVSFRKVWSDRNKQLREVFTSKPNLMFRALYWVSKDLFYESDNFKSALEPDASDLVKMRNHVEHKGFRVYEDDLLNELTPELLEDKLSYSISIEELQAKALKVLKLAREAIIYLSLGVTWEEREKVHDGNVASFQIDTQLPN